MVHHNIIKRIRLLAAASLLLLASLTPLLFSQDSYAAQLTGRSLTLQAVGEVEGSTPGGTVDHVFDFVMPASGNNFQSFKLLYCTTADIGETNCTAPTNMDATASTLGSQSGITGGTKDSSTANSFIISYGSAQTPSSQAVQVTLNNVTNTDDVNSTFYVRIYAYSNNDGTGSIEHAGTVAASTAEPIVLTGVMPESLIFCAGATIEESSPGVPDCSTASGGAINFNDLFSPTDTRYSFSQMAASTNAGDGYAITVNGPTLTSGSYTIPAMAAAAAPLTGVGQFGLNLVENTTTPDLTQATIQASPYNNVDGFDNDGDGGAVTPDVYSADVDQTPNGANLKGQAATDYNTDSIFKFASGDVVANSQYDGTTNTTPGPTDAQIFTVSYIANVPGSQAPGTYVTTLLYLCTPTF